MGASLAGNEEILETANVDLPVSAFTLLRILAAGSPLSVSQLAELLGLHQTTVSTQLRPLDEHQLIERAVDPNDRRVTSIAITPAGRAAYQRVRLVVADRWKIVLAEWSPRDRHRLAQLLERAMHDTRATIRALFDELTGSADR
jgi:DNA-binding MarR family transcriptional regulator